MATKRIDLKGKLIIEQGARYRKFALYYPGDVSAATFEGHLRREYDGELIAEWGFVVSYDAAINKTLILPIFTTAQTRNFPIPAPNKYFVYDIEMTVAGETDRLCQGEADVSRESTKQNV